MGETKLVSRLTWLGLVFLPLSFSTSIFSMSGDFQPGARHFWIFFAVAVPMLSGILGFAFIVSWVVQHSSRMRDQAGPLRHRLDKTWGPHSSLEKDQDIATGALELDSRVA